MKTAKVAISLPEAILRAIEEERKVSGESRSRYFQRAVEKLLKQETENAKAGQYIKQYTQIPETPIEVSQIHSVSRAALEQESW